MRLSTSRLTLSFAASVLVLSGCTAVRQAVDMPTATMATGPIPPANRPADPNLAPLQPTPIVPATKK